MIIAVFADIHGNLEAFTSVLQDIRREKIDTILSLGDNVGYGADSEKIMTLLDENRIESVLGNHELAVVNETFIKWFNPRAQQSVRYMQETLSRQSKQTIRGFAKSLVIGNMRFVHGAPPSSVALYLFQISDSNLAQKMSLMKETICFVGHTHDIGIVDYDGETLVRKTLKKGLTALAKDKKYIINVGSVGQPRDGDNTAKYVVFNTQAMTVDLRFVPYDYKKAAAKILQTGMSEEFAAKLYPRVK